MRDKTLLAAVAALFNFMNISPKNEIIVKEESFFSLFREFVLSKVPAIV